MTQSNEPSTIDMNGLIAIFDGWKIFKGDPSIVCPSCAEGKRPSGWCICYQKTDRFQKDGKMVSRTYFQYHTSWDALMPVGKKIRDLLQDMLKKRPPHTACKGDLIEVDIHCAVSEYDIAKAHQFIYQFITWYNQQTTTNEQ